MEVLEHLVHLVVLHHLLVLHHLVHLVVLRRLLVLYLLGNLVHLWDLQVQEDLVHLGNFHLVNLGNLVLQEYLEPLVLQDPMLDLYFLDHQRFLMEVQQRLEHLE
jgi:hypothetical protein